MSPPAGGIPRGPGQRRFEPAWVGTVLTILFIAGLSFPTSSSGITSKTLYMAAGFALMAVLLFLVARRFRRVSRLLLLTVLLMQADLWLATAVSPLGEYAWGACVPFAVLALVYCVPLDRCLLGRASRYVFILLNIAMLAAGAALALGDPDLARFFQNHYSAFYEGLVTFMLELKKPVLTFGTHSVAAFFYFLVVFLNLRTYDATLNPLYVVFAAGGAVLLVELRCISGMLYAAFTLWHLIRILRRRFVRAVLVTLAVTGLLAYALLDPTVGGYLRETAASLMAYDMGGFHGRYSEAGVLANNIAYLVANPYLPVGFTYDDRLMYGDSGPLEMLLRGSVPLLFAVYMGLFLFLKHNLVSRRDAIELGVVLLSFELAFSNLLYLRTLYVLPFVVVYLNTLRVNRELRPARRREAA